MKHGQEEGQDQEAEAPAEAGGADLPGMKVSLAKIGDHAGSRFYTLEIANGEKIELRAVATADAPKSIEAGTYRMVRDHEGRHRWWSIQHVEGRSHLEFHAGNWGLRDSEGCVLPGASIRWMTARSGERFLGVADSIATLNEMKRILGDGAHELVIG